VLLLGSCSLPATRSHWEEHHPRIWRKSHGLLTALVLIALGFLLKGIDRVAIPYFALAASLLSLECAVSLCRKTTVAAQVLPCPETGYYFQIQIPISSKPAVGLFFILRGIALPVAILELSPYGQTTIDENARLGETGYYIVLVPRKLLNLQPVPPTAIVVEGPYGFNIGFQSWISTWLTKISNALVSPASSNPQSLLCDTFARAITRSKGRPVVFIAQGTSVARVFSYFQCLSQPSVAKDKAAKLYLFYDDRDKVAPYCGFMNKDTSLCRKESSKGVEYVKDPILPVQQALNVLECSKIEKDNITKSLRRIEEELVHQGQAVFKEPEVIQGLSSAKRLHHILDSSDKFTVIAGGYSTSGQSSALIMDVRTYSEWEYTIYR